MFSVRCFCLPCNYAVCSVSDVVVSFRKGNIYHPCLDYVASFVVEKHAATSPVLSAGRLGRASAQHNGAGGRRRHRHLRKLKDQCAVKSKRTRMLGVLKCLRISDAFSHEILRSCLACSEPKRVPKADRRLDLAKSTWKKDPAAEPCVQSQYIESVQLRKVSAQTVCKSVERTDTCAKE